MSSWPGAPRVLLIAEEARSDLPSVPLVGCFGERIRAGGFAIVHRLTPRRLVQSDLAVFPGIRELGGGVADHAEQGAPA